MKAATVVFSIFMLQTNASFFDDESAFGKLLNDVVTDVKTTVRCTILAIEKVLSISGAVKEPSMDECYGYTDSKNDVISKLSDNDYKTISSSATAKDMSKQISSSIAKVNKTLTNILDNVENDRINHLKSVLQNETNRLTEISLLLKQELDKISQRVKDMFGHIDSDKSSVESIWNDLKILHEIEKNDKNTTEVNEISQFLNQAINVLHINTTNQVRSDEDKIKVIMQELEHDSPNNNNTFKNIDTELSQWKEERNQSQIYSNHNGISKDIPTSFKDVATKIFNDKNIERKEIEDHTNELENKIHNKKSFNDESQGVQTTSKSFIANSDLFDVLSEEEQKKAVDEAEDIIKKSANFEMVMNDILAKGEQASVDVFSNPKPFDFSNFK